MPEGVSAEAEWDAAGLPTPDFKAMRRWRLQRLRDELVRHYYAGAVLLDPINIRYATDASNMQVYCMYDILRYALSSPPMAR